VTSLWAFQRELLYSPDDVPYVQPSHYAMLDGVSEVTLRTSDGLALTSWYARAPSNRPTVVMFPGKSSSLRGQRYRVAKFIDAGMGVLLVGYRGYSGNPGAPTEQGLYRDAAAALDWLQRQGVPSASLILYGVSLGTGVATQMAAERPHAALILEAPYTSVTDVAAHRFPLVPVRWLVRDRFDSLARAALLGKPVLVMHGDADTVIPQALGRQLYAAIRAPKEGFWPQGVGHDDLFDRGGFESAVDFIERWLHLCVVALPAA
jgi:hypothetical protein